jgi:FixJ family two-component response regulator
MTDRPFVAVIDDDQSVRKALQRLLRSAGMEAACFPSADTFLIALARREPDCLVLDIRMPGTSGFELRDRLAALGRQIPIVFITAHAEDSPPEFGAGTSHETLCKPFGDDTLLDAIDRAIRRSKRA